MPASYYCIFYWAPSLDKCLDLGLNVTWKQLDQLYLSWTEKQRGENSSLRSLNVQAKHGQGIAVRFEDDHRRRVYHVETNPRVEMKKRQTGSRCTPSSLVSSTPIIEWVYQDGKLI